MVFETQSSHVRSRAVLYDAYQLQTDVMSPVRAMASVGRRFWTELSRCQREPGLTSFTRRMAAGLEMVERATLSHERPPFDIDHVVVNGETIPVTEHAARVAPFATLLHFVKDTEARGPKVLIVAPLSGHFATLLRATVRTMLADFDVYITDWHNARDVPANAGTFGIDGYTDHIIEFLEYLGPGSHLVAVCQPCVEALVATAVMAEAKSKAVPQSLTLMAGPIDTRISPTVVNDLATSKPITWFRDNVITTVPARYAGAGRRVYPGFLQLTAFVSMNPNRHIDAHWQMYDNLAEGRFAEAEVSKAFYDEYFAVLDLDADFYLETVEQVFQEHLLPRGEMTHHGRAVNLRAIRKTALLTVEGERDDICSVGQTMAAHDLTPMIRPYRRGHHLQAGVGHYGVFSGRRWENEIYPVVRNMIFGSA